MPVKFNNNATTTLNGAITAGATSIVVADASVFPAISSPDFAFLTMIEGANIEVIKVTDITGNTLTAVRGHDGTTASSFSDGARIDLRMTKALLDELHGSVSVSDNDTDPDRLINKLAGGAGVTLTETGDGGNETITVAVDPDAVATKTAVTGSAIIPVGTTAQRDGVAANGYIRANVTTGLYEGYLGGWISFGDLIAANNLSDVGNAATARTNLGLEIGVDVQGYDAGTAKTDVAQSFTAPQRAVQATVTDGTLDTNAAQDFYYTPAAADVLEFANETVGQSGFITLVNGSNYAITLGAEIEAPDGMATDISVTGKFKLGYHITASGGGIDTVSLFYVEVV